MNVPDIYFGQCWEDADILLKAFNIKPNSVCLSIASGGDNTLAMLGQNPKKVIAVDNNPAQIACLELKVAAYRTLSHSELLILMGSIEDQDNHRHHLYSLCRNQLSDQSRDFWDAHPEAITGGICSAGKFEKRFQLFSNYFIPLAHNSNIINQLWENMTFEERELFYTQKWNNWRWQLIFVLFFSSPRIKRRFGKEANFFPKLKEDIKLLSEHFRFVCTHLQPNDNPYLQWMIMRKHLTALPYALRPENFESIRNNLDRLEWYCCSVDDFLATFTGEAIDCYNLSNLFDVMSLDYSLLSEKLVTKGQRGGRLVSWNLLSKRKASDFLGDRTKNNVANKIIYLKELSDSLYKQDKVFLYKAVNVEEIC